jgi:hypothetical protein
MRRNVTRTSVILVAILLLLRDVCLETCPRRIAFSQITCSSLESLVLVSQEPCGMQLVSRRLPPLALQDEPSPYAVTLITDTRRVL